MSKVFLRWSILIAIYGFASCKNRESQTKLAANDTETVAKKLDETYLALAAFRSRVEQYFVPVYKGDTYTTVKHSEILQAEKSYESALDSLETLGIAVSEIRSEKLDAKAQRGLIFNRAELRLGGSYFTSLLSSIAAISAGVTYGSLWEACADIVVLNQKSYQHFFREISDPPFWPWGEEKLDSRGLSSFYSDDSLRTLMWNLAGRPRVRATINASDVYKFGNDSANQVEGSTGELEAKAGDKCTDEVHVHTPEEVKNNPGAIRDRRWVSALINDCPPKIVWKSGAWTSAMSNISNLQPMHEYALKYCPMIFVMIDELRMEKGPAAFPTFGGRKGISEMGQTRRMTKDSYMERLDEMIRNIDLKRKELRRGEDF